MSDRPGRSAKRSSAPSCDPRALDGNAPGARVRITLGRGRRGYSVRGADDEMGRATYPRAGTNCWVRSENPSAGERTASWASFAGDLGNAPANGFGAAEKAEPFRSSTLCADAVHISCPNGGRARQQGRSNTQNARGTSSASGLVGQHSGRVFESSAVRADPPRAAETRAGHPPLGRRRGHVLPERDLPEGRSASSGASRAARRRPYARGREAERRRLATCLRKSTVHACTAAGTGSDGESAPSSPHPSRSDSLATWSLLSVAGTSTPDPTLLVGRACLDQVRQRRRQGRPLSRPAPCCPCRVSTGERAHLRASKQRRSTVGRFGTTASRASCRPWPRGWGA